MKKEFQAMLVMVVFAIIGVILAAILGLLYTQGYITVFMLNGLTIQNLQFLVFFLCLIVGGVTGALTS